MVAYESFSLQSLSCSSNGVSQRRSLLQLVAYKSGRKESFGCIWAKKSLFCWTKWVLANRKDRLALPASVANNNNRKKKQQQHRIRFILHPRETSYITMQFVVNVMS